MTSSNTIYSGVLADQQRAQHVADLFGVHFAFLLEPTIFNLASRLSADYGGGYWAFHALSNGGFFMAPSREAGFQVQCPNGHDGTLSADAFGIVVCLYAYSGLAFRGDGFADVCAEHFHMLRALAISHAEAGAIMAAVD